MWARRRLGRRIKAIAAHRDLAGEKLGFAVLQVRDAQEVTASMRAPERLRVPRDGSP